MPVDTPRADYKAMTEVWCRLRDCMNGRDAVLKSGEVYVPSLPALDATANSAYRKRGSFYPAISRTVYGLAGMVFQKSPTFKLPDRFVPYLKDITLSNVTMEMFTLEAAHETMLVGRHGVLIDMAKQSPAPAPVIELRPYVVGYPAESIINWRTSRIGGDERLTMVVLQEQVETSNPKDPFVLDCAVQYRVCELVNGVYTQQIWQKDGKDDTKFIKVGDAITPTRRGEPLNFIPFIFLAPTHVTSEIAQPPLIDLADVNLGHWRNSVDYEYGMHLTALPTPWCSGVKDADQANMKIGPSVVWVLGEGGQAGMLEFNGTGLKSIADAMEAKEKQMASLGARMLETPTKLNETATATLIRHSGDYANLRTIAQSVEQGFTMVLQTVAWWMGMEEQPQDVKDASCELNKEFAAVQVDSQTVQVALAAVQAGKMSYKTFYGILTAGGWTREGIDAAAELEEIKTDPKPEVVVPPVKEPIAA